MSSVQSFLRQRVVGTTTLQANSAQQLYFLVAGSAAGAGTSVQAVNAASNYVGNYPPGIVVAGPLVSDLATNQWGAVGAPIIRDMGKTIYAQLGTVTGTTFGAPGFWRAVQVLNPVTLASATASSNFGVTGSAAGVLPSGGNAGDEGYNTFYIPIVVGGVVPGSAASPSLPLNVSSGANASPALLAGNVL